MSEQHAETKFMQYVKRLHDEKNPLQHRCKLTDLKKSQVQETRIWRRIKKPLYIVYVYLFLLPYNYHDTKFYYESNETVDHARTYHMKHHPFILHPFSRFRVYFDYLIIIPYFTIQIYLCSIPSFGLTIGLQFYSNIAYVLCAVGACYIMLNFLTGYAIQKKKKVVMKPSQIVIRYVLTYFVVDVGMMLPHILHVSLTSITQDPVLFTMVYFITVLRIFTFWGLIENSLRTVLNDRRLIYRIMLAIKAAYCLHICACVVGYIEHYRNIFVGLMSRNRNWRDGFVSYIDALTKIISRLYYSAAVSRPTNITVTTLLLFTVLFGTFVFSYVIAVVLMETLAETNQEIEYKELSSEVRNFARQEHRDPALRERIIEMFDVIFLGTLLKEQRVKQTIPDNLRRDLNSETIGALLRGTEFLSKLDNYLFLRLLDKLTLVVLLPNDHLVTEGQIGDSMYFLSTGRLVLYQDSVEIRHLDDGDNFAEEAILTDGYIYKETAIAGTPCFLYKLSKYDYIMSSKL